MTPEAKIKKRIMSLLLSYGEDLYVFMPVQTGYGKTTVDYLGCINGVFFGIEAKAPDGQLTVRQMVVMDKIRLAGGITFVVRNEGDLERVREFLNVAKRMRTRFVANAAS